jgi:hypothetical protein
MSEEIGKHKGAVETLLHEQKELSRILQIVNSQLERHVKALEDAGVDTDRFIKQFQEQSQKRQQAQQKQSQQKRSSREQQSQSGQKSSRNRNSSNNQQSSSNSSDDEKDMEDYFEEDDSDTRDFSPR